MYPKAMTQPLEEELTSEGFSALHAPEDVDAFIAKTGSSIIVINSVCGCAASVRPGVLQSLAHPKKPSNLGTVFAGSDTESVEHLRGLITEFPPSSPAVAAYKDGKLITMMTRNDILGKGPNEIQAFLEDIYEKEF
jgi:putative YphP/YqiW family bacilliredoxin